jgi:pilus assembly protein CpaB
MKKYGTVIALGLAVVFGALAVWLANQWLSTRVAEQEKIILTEAVPLTRIVVAARDLEIGTPLSSQTLTLAQWPKANMPQGAFEDIKQVEGRVAVSRLTAGQPLRAAELAAPGSGAGLVAMIPEGKRAMSIRVDEVIGVGGFILPNTYVDVIAVGDAQRGTQSEAKTILQRIKVLAIAQETTTEEGKAKIVRTVTMEVTPKDAEKLALQTHQGTIHLVLRNPLEEEQEEEVKPVVTKAPVRTAPVVRRPVYTPPPKPQPFEVEVIRGSTRQEMKFEDAESEQRVK